MSLWDTFCNVGKELLYIFGTDLLVDKVMDLFQVRISLDFSFDDLKPGTGR